LQVVCVNALPEMAPAAVHPPGATAVGPVVALLQVVVTKTLPDEAAAAEHDATGTFVVVIGVGQLIATKLFPAFAACTPHEAAGWLAKLFAAGLLHVRITHVDAEPELGVQVRMGNGPVTVAAGQVVVT